MRTSTKTQTDLKPVFPQENPGKNGLKESKSLHQDSSPDLQSGDKSSSAPFEISELQRLIERLTKHIHFLEEKVDALSLHEQETKAQVEALNERFLQQNGEILTAIDNIDFTLKSQPGFAEGENLERLQFYHHIREIVHTALPPQAGVVFVGDKVPETQRLYGRKVSHFPLVKKGGTTGISPSSDGGAIIQLLSLRALGGDFLVFPQSELWWLDRYTKFKEYLDNNYYVAVRNDACLIYDLRRRVALLSGESRMEWTTLLAECQSRLGSNPFILDWNSHQDLAGQSPGFTVFPLQAEETSLPYLNETVDVVALSSLDPDLLAEARRVAIVAVVNFAQQPENSGSRLTVEWKLEKAPVSLPTASIIIPTYNGLSWLKPCMEALKETLPKEFTGEIIVVDDASTDGTEPFIKKWSQKEPYVKYVKKAKNSGFIDSCNRGAEAATGDYLIFLNNDTIPLEGWIQPLLQTFKDYPETGAVGGKLIFPDGSLQEAGGLIFSDSSGANFGRGDFDITAPLYSFVREVDYCSGALLATPRSLFQEIGGFDSYYHPAYYEDTDYCFKIRERGLRVYYQPESAIIHMEGMSSENATIGMKRYQIVNREKFAQRWKKALARQHNNPQQFNQMVWLRLSARKPVEG